MPRRVDGAQGVATYREGRAIWYFVIEHGHTALAKSVDRHVETLAQLDRASNMVGMAVSDQDLADATTQFALVYKCLQVRGMRVRRVDDYSSIRVRPAQNDRVCARPGHQGRVRSQNTAIDALLHGRSPVRLLALCLAHMFWHGPLVAFVLRQ